jgi:hypothetical protein
VERYIFPLSNGTSFVNFDAILRKLQVFSDGRLEEKNLCIVLPSDWSVVELLKDNYCVYNIWAKT